MKLLCPVETPALFADVKVKICAAYDRFFGEGRRGKRMWKYTRRIKTMQPYSPHLLFWRQFIDTSSCQDYNEGRPMKKVTLFMKPGCYLCDEAYDQLEELLSSVTFEIETVDIRSSPELYERFRSFIPVVEVGDQTFKEGPFTRQVLDLILREVSQ